MSRWTIKCNKVLTYPEDGEAELFFSEWRKGDRLPQPIKDRFKDEGVMTEASQCLLFFFSKIFLGVSFKG